MVCRPHGHVVGRLPPASGGIPYRARDYVLDGIARHDATYDLGDTPLKVYQRIRELDLSEGRAASRFLHPPAGHHPGRVRTGLCRERH